jgi:LAS superfamily LD-carboxypeptidase LdcB
MIPLPSKKFKLIIILLFIIIIFFLVTKFATKKVPKMNDGDQIESILENKTKKAGEVVNLEEKAPTKTEIKKAIKVKPFICPLPQKEYEDMIFLNIGQETNLPDTTYIPKNLVKLEIESSTKNICLIKEAKEAFDLMVKEIKKDGLTIKASSGFRSYEYQKILLENAIKNGSEDANVSIAKAGYSEHQLGTAIDITSLSINYDSASGNFYKTKESDWLKKNAYLYGFIQSYPLGKEDITGYKSEPWHYRYVGIEKAKEIKDASLTITEFLGKLQN